MSTKKIGLELRKFPSLPEHLEAGGVGEGEPDVLDGGGRHVAEGGRQEDKGVEGGRRGVGVPPALPRLPPPPPDNRVVRHHAHHLADEHAAGLERVHWSSLVNLGSNLNPILAYLTRIQLQILSDLMKSC